MHRKRILLVLGTLVATACATDATDPVNTRSDNLRFVSGVHGAVDLLVDGTPVLTNLGLGANVGTSVTPGQHSVNIRKVGGGVGVARLVSFTRTTTALIVGTDAAGVLSSKILADTNAVVPAGKTKLRVAHFAAAAAPLSIWRNQPDYASMIRVQFPFRYNNVSPYLQSTVGDWRVMVSSEVNTLGPTTMPDTLAKSGTIALGSGTSKTVILVDGATPGTVQLIVVEP